MLDVTLLDINVVELEAFRLCELDDVDEPKADACRVVLLLDAACVVIGKVLVVDSGRKGIVLEDEVELLVALVNGPLNCLFKIHS